MRAACDAVIFDRRYIGLDIATAFARLRAAPWPA